MSSTDFQQIPYGFDEFARGTLAQWQQQAGAVEPWPAGACWQPL